MKKSKMNKAQKLFLVGAVLVGATGLFMNHAKSADLLYSAKPPKGYIDASGWYFGGKGGANFGNDFSGVDFDTGYSFGGVLGYQFGELGPVSLRTEAEVGYLNSDADVAAPFSGSLSAVYGFLNAYGDFSSVYGFTPFIGGGLGYADVKGEAQVSGFPLLDTKDQNFAWNATAGLSYEVSPNVSIDLAYRYLTVQDVTFNTVFGAVNDDVNIHQVNAGFRVKL